MSTMKITLLAGCLLSFFVNFRPISSQNANFTEETQSEQNELLKSQSESTKTSQAIQIVTFVNRSLQFELDDIKRILAADDIKDRYVVVVSLASTIQEEGNVLLEFFLRFLHAQVTMTI